MHKYTCTCTQCTLYMQNNTQGRPPFSLATVLKMKSTKVQNAAASLYKWCVQCNVEYTENNFRKDRDLSSLVEKVACCLTRVVFQVVLDPALAFKATLGACVVGNRTYESL